MAIDAHAQRLRQRIAATINIDSFRAIAATKPKRHQYKDDLDRLKYPNSN